MKKLTWFVSGVLSLVVLSPAFAVDPAPKAEAAPAKIISGIKPVASNARIIPMNVAKAQEALEIIKLSLQSSEGLTPAARQELALKLRSLEAMALFLKETMIQKRQMLTSIYVQVGLDVSLPFGAKGIQPGVQSGIGFAIMRTQDPETQETDWAFRMLHLSGVNAEYKFGKQIAAYEGSGQIFFGVGLVFPDNDYGKEIVSLSDLATTYTGIGGELSLGKNFKWLNTYRIGGGVYTVGNPLRPKAHMFWLMPIMLGSGDRAIEVQGEVLFAHFFKDARIRDEGVFYDFED